MARPPVIRWGRVAHSCDRAIIIASGPSLRDVDLSAIRGSIAVVAVNAAIEHVPRADFFFSLDLSKENRRRLREQREGVAYYAAVPQFYGHPAAVPSQYRDPPEENVTFLRRVHGPDRRWVIGLSEDPGAIHHGNSAWGAVQLVWLMGARRIALLGVDGSPVGYAWGDGSPRALDHLPGLFRSAVPQLERAGVHVINGSPKSTVTCWPRVKPEEAIAWVQGDAC